VDVDPRHARSRGLQRVNRLTGWLAAGALAVSGAFVALLARPHTTAAASHPPAGSGAGEVTTTTLDPYAGQYGGSVDGGGSAQPLAPPTQAPLPTVNQGQVSSGGS
jgi:hypothetical protein